jgi:hypothetical protein
MTLRDGLIADIRDYPGRVEAAAQAGVNQARADNAPITHSVTPILNVSDLAASIEWFGKLGWTRNWTWAGPDGVESFGAVSSGEAALFLCLNGQGARGVWMSVWVDDVDAVHAACQGHALDVVRAPLDEPWGVREMHVRHPDGHMLRVSAGIHHHWQAPRLGSGARSKKGNA